MTKVVAIIQARVGSARLKRKVLMDIIGKPMLWHVINRLKRSKLINEIVLATTTKKEDAPLLKIAEDSSAKVFRGSEEDVLDRYFRAATKYDAKTVVRITADCPLIDPKIVDDALDLFLEGDYDYVGNTEKPTFPDGLDVEVFSYGALKKAWGRAARSSEREHVTSYIRNHPEIFKIGNLENEKDLSHMRWTVDEERDLEFVKEIYKKLYKKGKVFYTNDVLKLLKKHPELTEINKGVARNEGHAKSLREDRLVR
jgi:spore coat polysaccharide biosynthesis protein SpsF (cytidylyltransferase family)